MQCQTGLQKWPTNPTVLWISISATIKISITYTHCHLFSLFPPWNTFHYHWKINKLNWQHFILHLPALGSVGYQGICSCNTGLKQLGFYKKENTKYTYKWKLLGIGNLFVIRHGLEFLMWSHYKIFIIKKQ